MSDDVTFPAHGGNLEAIASARGIAQHALLDFSANINPLGPPAALLDALRIAASDVEHLTHYPEPTYRALRKALGRAYALDPESIVVGNGGAALLDAAIATLGSRRALVPTPAFSEYRRALASRGAAFIAAPLDRARDFAIDASQLIDLARAHAVDTVIVNTPHNPTGATLSRDASRALVRSLTDESRATIVDEAFVDFVEDESIVKIASCASSLVVVRSLTKFFAVPALRVGFAVARPDLAARMRAVLPSWPVTSLAARAIAAAIADGAYADRTRAENIHARERLRCDLRAIGLRALPSVANYVLVELPSTTSATTVTARMIDEHAIVLRDCTSYDDLEDGRFVRIAVRSGSDNARLIVALRDVVRR